jgi:hypothetical protein
VRGDQQSHQPRRRRASNTNSSESEARKEGRRHATRGDQRRPRPSTPRRRRASSTSSSESGAHAGKGGVTPYWAISAGPDQACHAAVERRARAAARVKHARKGGVMPCRAISAGPDQAHHAAAERRTRAATRVGHTQGRAASRHERRSAQVPTKHATPPSSVEHEQQQAFGPHSEYGHERHTGLCPRTARSTGSCAGRRANGEVAEAQHKPALPPPQILRPS